MKLIRPELIDDLKKGDHDSFRTLFDQFGKPVYLFSLRYLKSEEIAEDVVQEVFLKVWNNRSALKTDTSIKSYLFTIAINIVRKHFLAQAKLNDYKHTVLAELYENAEKLDVDENYHELLNRLRVLIDRMPEKRRQVFIRKRLENKSLKEIAEEFNIDTKTVEYHITEAMRFLKKEFAKLKLPGIAFFYLFISRQAKINFPVLAP